MSHRTADSAELAPTVPHAPSRNLLQVAWQHRFLILFMTVLGLVVALLAYSQKKPIYQSSAQILIVKKRSDALPVASGDARISFYEDYAATHLVVLRSPVIAERAVEKRGLESLPSFAGDPVGVLRTGLTATRDNSKDANATPNNIVTLTFKGTDSADCAAALNAVIDSYREFLDKTYRNDSENNLAQIMNAKDHLEKDLQEKQQKYNAFRKTAPFLWKESDGVNLHKTRIKDFLTRETALIERGAELRERLKAVENAKNQGSPLSALLKLATPPQEKDHALPANLEKSLEEQLFPLLLKEKALLSEYGKDYPETVRVREQISMTREFIARLDKVSRKNRGEGDVPVPTDPLEVQLLSLRQELALVETSGAALAQLLKDEEAKARALEQYEYEDRNYINDIANTTDLRKQILKRLEEVNLVRDYGGFEAKVIAAPGMGGKVAPLAWQFLGSGILLGLFSGLGLAYSLDVLDKSFRTPEEIRRRLGLPVMGHVPFLTVGASDAAAGRLDPLLLAHHRPTSPEAEAYRGVRTALFFSTRADRHKVIQVTSPQMGDGKSLLIANLAVSIAQSGRRVVVVDADLRRGRLHRIFGVTSKTGLAAVIAGSMDVQDNVQKTDVPNLFVLPCGTRPANPAELLTDPRFEEVLEELRNTYDFVLVDTPPLLAVSDPSSVSPRVDGVLFVLRPGKNGRPPAERARDLLAESGALVFGVIVNGVGKSGVSGYGYDHYAPGYEYAADYTESAPEPEALPGVEESDEVRPTVSVNRLTGPHSNGHAKEPPLSAPPGTCV